MQKWEKRKGKMQNSLMEKWTEIEKINKGLFSSGYVVYTINFLSVLHVQVNMVENSALKSSVV